MPSKAAQRKEVIGDRKMLISAEDYQRMAAAGIFDDKARMELLDGEIYTMSPFTPSHNGHVDKVSRFFNNTSSNEVIIRTLGSIRIDQYSEPEPDIAILRFDKDFYSKKQVGPKDIHLIIEVAISTIQTDQGIKKEKYAKAGIPEYWIVMPEREAVEVYRKVKDGDYLEKMTYSKSDEWIFGALDLTVKGSDLLI